MCGESALILWKWVLLWTLFLVLGIARATARAGTGTAGAAGELWLVLVGHNEPEHVEDNEGGYYKGCYIHE